MATTTHVPVEVYLRSSYEPDAEYVDGKIEERPMGRVRPCILATGDPNVVLATRQRMGYSYFAGAAGSGCSNPVSCS